MCILDCFVKGGAPKPPVTPAGPVVSEALECGHCHQNLDLGDLRVDCEKKGHDDTYGPHNEDVAW